MRGLIEGIFSGDASLTTGPFASKWRDDLFLACRGLLLTMPTQLAGTVFAPARAAHMPHLWAALSAMASVGKIVSAASSSSKGSEQASALAAPAPGGAEDQGEDEAKAADEKDKDKDKDKDKVDTSAGVAAVAGMLEPVKSAEESQKDAAAMLHRRRLCENHDDSVTEASWACMGCVDLRAEDTVVPTAPEGKPLTEDETAAYLGLAMCDQCDSVVHLPRNRRLHKRTPIKHRADEALKVSNTGPCLVPSEVFVAIAVTALVSPRCFNFCS